MLAEDLLLLLTDDATGKLLLPAEQVDIALGGANLLELTLLERVSLDDEKHVVVIDPSSTGDPILDGALRVIGARQGRKPKAVVEPLGENLRTVLYARLVAEGVLRAQEKKVLGILPVHRWPAARAEHEDRSNLRRSGAPNLTVPRKLRGGGIQPWEFALRRNRPE